MQTAQPVRSPARQPGSLDLIIPHPLAYPETFITTVMAKRDTRNEDARGSEDQSNDDYTPPATDKDNESQHPSSPRSTQIRGNEQAIGDNSEDRRSSHLKDSTSDGQLQSVSQDPQVCTNFFQQGSIYDFGECLWTILVLCWLQRADAQWSSQWGTHIQKN